MFGMNPERRAESGLVRWCLSARQASSACVAPWILSHCPLLIWSTLVLAVLPGIAADQPESNGDSRASASRLIEGKVTAIVDGDTLHLAADDTNYVVELAGIDAPEKGQPSGDMAAQVLYLKVLRKQVQLLVLPAPSANPMVQTVVPSLTSPAGTADATSKVPVRCRAYGILYCEGCVNRQLVGEGIAWHDSQACPSASLAQAEESARRGRRGLWQNDRKPTPPWLWRSQQRTSVAAKGVLGLQGQEVQDLSRLFEAKTPAAVIEAAAQIQPVAAASPPSAGPRVSSGGTYWLTDSSGIRHNSSCRYYKKSKGRPCNGTEGRPCQRCGG